MRTAFDAALAEVRGELGGTDPMVIDGRERTTRAAFSVVVQADNSVPLGVYQSGTRRDVDDAVAAARAAYPGWSGLDYRGRVRILRRAAELVRERTFRISALLVRECGRNRTEAIGEVAAAADVIDEYTAQMEATNGFMTPLGSLVPGEKNRSVLRPFGVGGEIMVGEEILRGGQFDRGAYVALTVIDGAPPSHELFHRELFLPVVVVASHDTRDEAIRYANHTGYSRIAGIFSEDLGEIRHFMDGIEAGVVHANRKGGATTGAWPGCQSFAGGKGSGSSGKGGPGPWYVQQFMREQSRTNVVDDAGEDPYLAMAACE